jgi:hypothetical protein
VGTIPTALNKVQTLYLEPYERGKCGTVSVFLWAAVSIFFLQL